MLNIYLSNEEGVLKETNTITSGCWINMVAPTEQEIQFIAQKLELPNGFLKDSLDEGERSRIEKDGEDILIIVNVPNVTMNEKKKPEYDTIPLGIIIAKNCFVTICLQDNPIFQAFSQGKVKDFFTYKRTRFAFQILYSMSNAYLKYLKQISKKIDTIEGQLLQSMRNKELFSLLHLQKSLVYFTTSLKTNDIVMHKMMKSRFLKMYEDDQDLLEDVIIENQQAIEMAETHASILSSMMDAFASIISNNVSMVMKFLTSFTIVLSFPTMVASFYGMNVDIPYQEYKYAFFVAILISTILSSITAVVFWRKRFF
ncbi:MULTISPECIES: magnesium transporter CorA family protein [Bacillaceae]|uniref:magnesium transporter CorA family protein n=1 Tax=Bacillaceae TaxID=186817 RepID=UPI001E400234|nr:MULTISPECIES: magnesium transporter CorA family protein [Bacillaceae]MCE4048166.1 magnesium transporter CorA family protein [Bacillus sp. Au-Bac7]MCM3033394.1 magnesium transporter CorA family protein [Niallia sp. MER 6]MDL0434315.1 magnesium transporter CorA family protein [Niallia sp. SS-2023]UPO89063.1 magnesium transporter CorA family protein [Niallia sp. Man26]